MMVDGDGCLYFATETEMLEWAEQRRKMFEACMPKMKGTPGKIVISSNPSGSNAFYDMWKNIDKNS